MKREIYNNGQLIEIFEDLEMQAVPDWGTFNRQMISNLEYNRISNQTLNQRAVSRLETLAIQRSEDFNLYKLFWDAIVEESLLKPTEAAITAWNAIAFGANMPFSFDADGKMQLGGEL